MNKGGKKIFADKNKLFIALNLRRCGFCLLSIAKMMGCDKKSVRGQCKKYGIKPLDNPFPFWELVKGIIPHFNKGKWDVVKGEKINRGKTYAEYLSETHQNIPTEYW